MKRELTIEGIISGGSLKPKTIFGKDFVKRKLQLNVTDKKPTESFTLFFYGERWTKLWPYLVPGRKIKVICDSYSIKHNMGQNNTMWENYMCNVDKLFFMDSTLDTQITHVLNLFGKLGYILKIENCEFPILETIEGKTILNKELDGRVRKEVDEYKFKLWESDPPQLEEHLENEQENSEEETKDFNSPFRNK